MRAFCSVSPIDNFWYAVFATVLCCPAWPLGVTAIFFGNRAREARINDDFPQAVELGKRAALLGHLTVLLGLFIYVVAYFVKMQTMDVRHR